MDNNMTVLIISHETFCIFDKKVSRETFFFIHPT